MSTIITTSMEDLKAAGYVVLERNSSFKWFRRGADDLVVSEGKWEKSELLAWKDASMSYTLSTIGCPPVRRERPFNRNIFGSGPTLHFHNKDVYDAYEKEIHDIQMKYYGIERELYGIWAGNQNKYVTSVEELKPWDSLHMEVQYANYLKGK